MVAEPTNHQASSGSYLVALQKPIYGYARLTFFNTRVWQYLIIFLFIVGVAALVFPGQRMLVNHYRNKDLLPEALSVLTKPGKASKGDASLLLLTADLYRQAGEPEKAIDTLERLLHEEPNNQEALKNLVDLYAGVRNIDKLIHVLKRNIKANPTDIPSLKRLAELYAYQGQTHRQMDTIIHLIQLEKNTPLNSFFPDISGSQKAQKIKQDPLIKAVGKELDRLIKIRSSEGQSPLLDELIHKLYLYRLNVMQTIVFDGAPLFPNRESAVYRVLEPYVRSGMITEGNTFAGILDADWQDGVKNRLRLVQILRWDKQNHEAFELLSELHAANEDEIDILYLMASIALENKETQTVISLYQKIIEKQPDDLEYTYKLVDLYIAMGKINNAFKLFQQISSKTRACEPVLNEILKVSGYTNNRYIALEAAALSRRFCWGNLPSMKTAAETLLAVGEERESVIAYSDYLKMNPADSDAADQLAALYMWINEAHEAYALYKKLLISSDDSSTYLPKLISAATNTEDSLIIREAALLALSYRPEDPDTHMAAAELLTIEGLYQDAIDIYLNHISRNPEDTKAIQRLATIYLWTDKSQKAAKLLSKASDKHPKNVPLAISAADAWIAAENTKAGISYLKRASGMEPEDLNIRKRLVTYYQWAEETDRLIEELEFLDAKGQVDGPEKSLLAQAYLDRNQGKLALKHLKPFEERSTLPVKEGLMLASAYELIGQANEAVKIYKRIGKENAKNPDLLAQAGEQALWLNKYDTALSLFESALKSDPKNLKALKRSGQIYVWQNQPKKAILRLEKYNRIYPNDYEVRYQLGELHYDRGHKHNAFRHYKRAMTLIRKQKRRGVEKHVSFP